jgi:putative restriction endonuclease
MLGISPDYVVKVDAKLLEEVDGPMLLHGLQEMHGTSLTVPVRRKDRPDKDRLEQRFAEFVGRAS